MSCNRFVVEVATRRMMDVLWHCRCRPGCGWWASAITNTAKVFGLGINPLSTSCPSV